MKILIIEDEKELLHEIKKYLEKENYLCEIAADFYHAEEKIAVYEYDIAIVDISLPGGSGLEIINRLKKMQPATGIVFVSAKNSLDDRVTGLEIGADDYLSKPFHLAELNARIKALIRRRKFDGCKTITFNEIEILVDENTVRINGNKIILTKKESELLIFFIANKNRLITKESIVEHLWGDDIDLVDSYDFIYTHINNLRKKITHAQGHDYIQNVYGMGYKFTDN